MSNKMTIVRKAIAQDFEKIYPLFKSFENARLQKNDWQLLFIDHWKSKEGYFGYVLEDKKRIARAKSASKNCGKCILYFKIVS